MNTELGFLTDDELVDLHDRSLAKLALAERYSHNLTLAPAIRSLLERIHAEEARRMIDHQRSHL